MGNCSFRARVENQSAIGTITPPRPGYSKDKGNHQQNGRLPTSVGVDEDASVIEQGYILPCPKLRIYSFADLKAATRNFKPDSVLGQGGFGTVFKGWVDEKTYAPCKTGVGLSVAVKKLNSESEQGHREWQSEVNFLGRLAHPNLVKLLGYCCEDREFLLVYEFMPKGSLENHLFRRWAEPLSWTIRLKIAIDAARGLAFLHSSEKQVIYRDFKSANILLDSEFNAKLSDFGLAKDGPLLGDSHVTTRVVGTYGYAAPEYLANGRLYVKSDVYAFGVVLLEMLTGLQAFDQCRPTGEQNLVNWLQPSLSDRNKLRRILDTKFEGKYPMKGAMQVAQLTLRCIRPKPRERPSMKEVVEALEKIEAIKPAEAPKARSSTHKHISNDQPRSSRVHLRPAMINSHHLQKQKPFNY